MFLAVSITQFLGVIFNLVSKIFAESQFLTLFWVFMAVSFLSLVPVLIRRFIHG